MRRLIAYLLLAALPLCFSCDKAVKQDAPISVKGSSAWQKAQWDRCSQEIRKYLDSSVRAVEMRTLDAAYMAILAAEIIDGESCVIPFTTGDVPCEARIQRNGRKASVTVLRNGETVGCFTMDEDSFTGESTGIKIEAGPFSADDAELHAEIVFSSEGVSLASFKAEGPLELVDLSLELPEGICLMGSVEARRLWEALRAISDEDSRDKVIPLVEEAAAAVHIGVYYEGELVTPRARVSVRPHHILSRYDDYWTWEFIILTENGEVLEDAWKSLGGLDSATAGFVAAWRNLMPHILL